MNRLTGTAVGCGLALVLLLSGCGGGSDASAGPTDPASSSSDAADSPSSAPSTDESPSSTPTVVPATGPLLKQEHATMNAPTGYRRQPDMVPFETSAGSKQLGSIDVVSLSQMPWGDDANLDEAVRLTIKTSWPDGPRPKRLEDVDLDGVPAFHLAGPAGEYKVLEEYGALYDGDLVHFTFVLDNINSKAKRRAAIESALATVRWR